MAHHRLTTGTALAALLAAALSAAPAAVRAQEEARFAATTLSVGGEGEVRAAPDTAFVTVGVAATAPTASAAAAQMRTRLASTLAALKGAGTADRDLQTSNLTLGPRYDEAQGRPRTLTGYEASGQVVVTVRDVARTGAVVDAATAAGADTVEGIAFDIADRAPLEDAALRMAVKAAAARAQLMAEAAGLHVKRLVSLGEGGALPPSPAPFMRRAAFAAPMALPTAVQPGELHVHAVVAAVYELER